MFTSTPGTRKTGRGRGRGRGWNLNRERYELRSKSTRPEESDNDKSDEEPNKVSPNDEKIWNLVTNKTANANKQVKIKQEIIDTAENPYDILNYKKKVTTNTEVTIIGDDENETEQQKRPQEKKHPSDTTKKNARGACRSYTINFTKE